MHVTKQQIVWFKFTNSACAHVLLALCTCLTRFLISSFQYVHNFSSVDQQFGIRSTTPPISENSETSECRLIYQSQQGFIQKTTENNFKMMKYNMKQQSLQFCCDLLSPSPPKKLSGTLFILFSSSSNMATTLFSWEDCFLPPKI